MTQENAKGTLVVVTHTGYNRKKEIMYVPMQNIELEPNYTVLNLMNEHRLVCKENTENKAKIKALEEKVAKQTSALNTIFNVVELLLNQNALNNYDISELTNTINSLQEDK